PGRLIGFAFINPQADRGRVARLVDTAVHSYGFAGIKIHQHDGRITRELCEVARRHALPVLYDVMGEVTIIDLIPREYPEINFITPHLGSFADDYRAQVALIDVIVRQPNVYTDSAGVRRFDLLEEAVARAGARKVLFGSDGPWLHPGVELAKIRELRLRPEAERLVLGQNLLRLIGKSKGNRQERQEAPRSLGVGGP